MTLHLRPETEARLAAHAADLRISIDDYLEALVEKELTVDYGKPLTSTVGQFQKEQGLWFYRTGDPMPISLVEDTLESIRRGREESSALSGLR